MKKEKIKCSNCGSSNVIVDGNHYCCRACGASNISWSNPYEWSRLMYEANDELTVALKAVLNGRIRGR